jgi:hypothetical protein
MFLSDVRSEGRKEMRPIQYGNWVLGGVLRVFSRRRGIWHFGILAGTGPMGWMVMHASKDRGGFVITTYAEFCEGQPIEYTWLPATYEKQEEVLQRAQSQLGQPYNLLMANCEDYVNWIVTGVARSPQREAATVGALVLFVLGGLLFG